MKDQDVLEKLLPIALSLLECKNTPLHALSEWGDTLYDIHKYLEKRLSDNPVLVSLRDIREPGEALKQAIKSLGNTG